MNADALDGRVWRVIVGFAQKKSLSNTSGHTQVHLA